MDQREWMTERFEANRAHLRQVAYRMLGSRSEADDAVRYRRRRAPSCARSGRAEPVRTHRVTAGDSAVTPARFPGERPS